MNSKRFILLSAGIMALAIICILIFSFYTSNLQKILAQFQDKEKEMAQTIAMYEQMFAMDSLLVTGHYTDAIKISEEKWDEVKDRNNLVQLRIAVAKKFRDLNDGLHVAAPQTVELKAADSGQVKHSLTSKEIRLLDSLSFALEKTKVQLSRLKRRSKTAIMGDYLTFLTSKGSKAHYVGEVKNKTANGHGIALLNTGSRYEGEWKNNLRHGEGTFYWPDGEYYVGQYKNDKRHGEGTYYWSNGEKFVGFWNDDERTGAGTFYNKEGEILVNGVWEDDQLVAQNQEEL